MRSLLLAALTLLLAGCPATPARYPVPLAGEFPAFPPQAAGFSRERVLAYAPGTENISVGYNLLQPEAQIAATLYQYAAARQAPTLERQFVEEKANIERVYQGATKDSEQVLTLRKGERQFQAMQAGYRYTALFMQQRQEVYSELIVWKVDDRYVKLRSTTKYGQRAVAALKNRELLDAIDWTVRP